MTAGRRLLKGSKPTYLFVTTGTGSIYEAGACTWFWYHTTHITFTASTHSTCEMLMKILSYFFDVRSTYKYLLVLAVEI